MRTTNNGAVRVEAHVHTSSCAFACFEYNSGVTTARRAHDSNSGSRALDTTYETVPACARAKRRGMASSKDNGRQQTNRDRNVVTAQFNVGNHETELHSDRACASPPCERSRNNARDGAPVGHTRQPQSALFAYGSLESTPLHAVSKGVAPLTHGTAHNSVVKSDDSSSTSSEIRTHRLPRPQAQTR